MANRPKSITVISWFLMIASAITSLSFIGILSGYSSSQIASVSLVGWWFLFGAIPLHFVSGLLMLKGRRWGRHLYLAVGLSGLIFSVVILPFTIKLVGQALFFAVTLALLYRPQANQWFANPHMVHTNAPTAP